MMISCKGCQDIKKCRPLLSNIFKLFIMEQAEDPIFFIPAVATEAEIKN